MEENTNVLPLEQQNFNNPVPQYGGQMPAYDPVRQELHSVRMSGNGIGFTVFGFFACQFIPAIIIVMFNLYPIYTINEVTEQCFNILISIFCTLFPFIIYALAVRKPDTELLPLGKPKLSLFVPLVFAGMAIAIIGNFATGMLVQNMQIFGITLKSPEPDNTTTLWGIILSAVSTAVIPALAEELAMRGIVLQSLRKFGDDFAIFMSSFLFAVMHGNFVQAPFAFIVGLAFGYITVKTGSLWCSIAIHFFNNLMAVLLSTAELMMEENAYLTIYYLVFFLILCAGIASIIFMLKKHPEFFKLNGARTLTTLKQKAGAFIGTPGVIIALIAVALFSAKYLEASWL